MPASLNSSWVENTQQKKGLPSATLPGEEGSKINTQKVTCLLHSPTSSYGHTGPLGLPPLSQRALAALGNIALFLSLRLFSFLIENAKYSEG